MAGLNSTILELLRASEGHMTADEMFDCCKENGVKVSLASVYRVLGSLADDGEIKRISIPGHADVFDKTLQEHQHMVCSVCGRVKDINVVNFRKLLEESAGTKIQSYDLNVRYVCEGCRQ